VVSSAEGVKVVRTGCCGAAVENLLEHLFRVCDVADVACGHSQR